MVFLWHHTKIWTWLCFCGTKLKSRLDCVFVGPSWPWSRGAHMDPAFHPAMFLKSLQNRLPCCNSGAVSAAWALGQSPRIHERTGICACVDPLQTTELLLFSYAPPELLAKLRTRPPHPPTFQKGLFSKETSHILHLAPKYCFFTLTCMHMSRAPASCYIFCTLQKKPLKK